MDSQWWVSINGDQKGPLSTPTLQTWFAEGRVPPDSLIRAGCDGPWVLARKVKLFHTDWHGLLGGVAVASAILIAVEIFWLAMTHPGVGAWGVGLLAVYAVAVARVFGLKKLVGGKKR